MGMLKLRHGVKSHPSTNDCDVRDSFRYLGHRVESFGVKRPNLYAFRMMLLRVHCAPLKLDQMLSVLRQCLIPRLLCELQNPGFTDGLLTATTG